VCVCSQLGKSLGLSDIPTVVAGSPGFGQKTCAGQIVELAGCLKVKSG
jgi:hypothetical protein